MAIIENYTKKRVMILEIEFLEDSTRNIWISFFREIKIIDPAFFIDFSVNAPDDLKGIPVKSPSKTKFEKLANGRHILERCKTIQSSLDCIFFKGHIRNQKSDLGIDLSILPPANYNQLENHPKSPSSKLIKSISIKNSGIQASNSKSHNENHLVAKRARALLDEIMKFPKLKTKFGLNGLIGVVGINIEKKLQGSLTFSKLAEERKMQDLKKSTSTSRLILKDNFSPRSSRR